MTLPVEGVAPSEGLAAPLQVGAAGGVIGVGQTEELVHGHGVPRLDERLHALQVVGGRDSRVTAGPYP